MYFLAGAPAVPRDSEVCGNGVNMASGGTRSAAEDGSVCAFGHQPSFDRVYYKRCLWYEERSAAVHRIHEKVPRNLSCDVTRMGFHVAFER